MRSSLRLGSLFGVELKLDSSWIFIFALVVFSLMSLFSNWHADWTPALRLAVAVASALAFFASILLHELAHAAVAKLYKIPVRDITLHMFGGVSNIEREPEGPLAEFLIAIVGPIVSVGLGIVMLVIATHIVGEPGSIEEAGEAAMRMGPLTTLLMWLGPVNVMIGLFNLIPGFPLDGGRILRSFLWMLTRDLHQATQIATACGKGVGWAFIALGLFMAFGHRVPFFGTGLVQGMWLGLIGLFLRNAANAYRMGQEVEGALQGIRAMQLMRTPSGFIDANASISELLNDLLLRDHRVALAVLDHDEFVGMVRVENVRGVPRDRWDEVPVRSIMAPFSALDCVAPDATAMEAARIAVRTGREVPVLSNRTLLGVIFPDDVARVVAQRQDIDHRPPINRTPLGQT